MTTEKRLPVTKNAEELLVQDMQANYAQYTQIRGRKFGGRGNNFNKGSKSNFRGHGNMGKFSHKKGESYGRYGNVIDLNTKFMTN